MMTHEEKRQLEHVLERKKGPMTWGETQALVKAILEIHRVIYEKVAPPSDFSF